MSEKYKPVKGDRVRVVLEGEADTETGDQTFWLGVGSYSNSISPTEEHVVSIEKIEPDPVLPDGLLISEDGNLLNWLGENYVRQQVEEPVEVFKPGDVVRRKGSSDHYVIGIDGYFSFQGNDFREHDEEFLEDAFTSESYEKVALG